MNGILITGGEIPKYEDVSHFFKDSYICVADSGLDWVLDNGINFDTVVGDMDSISSRDRLKEIDEKKVFIHPKDKDDTDTIIGLKFLKDRGFDNITLIGGGGGRLDHLLGIFSLFETNLAPTIWCTHREKVFYLKGKMSLKKYYQCGISIYPIYKDRCSIRSNGLKWELDHVDWTCKSIGISNFVMDKYSWVDSGDDEFIVIVPLIGNEFD